MNFIQCTLTEIRRRPIKYLIFTITFSVIFSALMVGLNLRATVMQVKEKTIAIIGPYFQLELREALTSQVLIEQIEELEHVKGVNRSEIEFVIAGNFQTVKEYEGVTPAKEPSIAGNMGALTSNSVILDANLDCSLIDHFRLGDSVLISGRLPAEAGLEVVVEQKLMELNGFELGDTMLLQYVNGEEVAATIVGVYETRGSFVLTEANTVGEAAFAWSPYNRVYAGWNVAEQLFGLDAEQYPLAIYGTSVSAMGKLAREIKELPLDTDKYELVNMTETKYQWNKQASQIEELSSYASWIMYIALGTGAILGLLILNMFLQYYIREAGILIALGCGKMRTVLQHLTSTGLIAAVAAVIAAVISALVSPSFIGKLIQDTTVEWALTGVFGDGLEHVVSFVPRGMTWEEGGLFFLGVIFLLLVAAIPLWWRMVRFTPCSILTD